jgi:hypothetical protein
MKFARFVLPARTFRRPDSIGAAESIFIDLADSVGRRNHLRSCAMKSSRFSVSLRYLGLALFLLILPAPTTQAQTYIFGKADFPVGAAPLWIARGDFNGDGISDLAVVNESSNTVSVLLGNPDGTFAPQLTYDTGLGPLAVVTGDFNGDGNLDLAVTNGDCTSQIPPQPPICNGTTFSILLGNGDGTFRSHIDYPSGNQPSSVAAADFNGDGKLDLAISSNQGGVSILLGNGDGTFQAPVEYAASSSQSLITDVIVADFNGDGKLDLAVGGSEVSVLLGNGNGTFQAAVNSPGSSPLAAADFNGDGKLDLFADGKVLLGNGNGTFTLYATYPTATAAAAADLNGDGKPDLAITQGDDNGSGNSFSIYSVSVLLGNGDGTFQAPALYGTAIYPSYLLIADFNGDGKLDLAVADTGNNFFPYSTPAAVSILLGFGDGTFVGQTDYSSSWIPYQLLSADFNGDGKPDIGVEGVSAVAVYLGNGDGTFQPEVETSLTQPALGFAAGDFNGDGKADVATVYSNCTNGNCPPGDAVVLISNGDGTFQTPVEYAVGLQSEHVSPNVAVGDFNGDGKPDLAVTNLGANTVSILLNNGGGTFQTHVDYPAGTGPTYIVTGDFNGDGILDLAILDSNGIFVLLGNGNGTFNQGTQVSTLFGYAIAAGDFNADGKLDLAVTSGGTEGTLFIFLGNGDGTFQAPVSYPDGQLYGLPSVSDLTGDGKLDLIVGPSAYGYIASILLGNGDGSFQAPMFDFLSNTSNIVVVDFNQDGSPDLASGQSSSLGASLTVMLSAAFKAISPASLNFGSQGVGTTSPPQTITISNSSNVVLNIASIVASGNFSQTNDCVGSLAIGAHCTVNVTFAPTTTGLLTGAITVTDSTKISPVAIPLSGTGVNGPFLTPYPNRVNFSPQNQGTSSSPATIMLVNTGNAALSISSIGITGADASSFSQKNTCGSSLVAGASCSVNVTFTPTAGGSLTASVSISDSAPGSPQSVSLSGTGLGPVASLSPNQLTFASQTVGTTSSAQVVTLTNTGSGPLNITSIAASGDFGETNTCNTSLAAGSSCQISVTFTPTAAGNRTGSIKITDNAAGSPQMIALSGTGAAVPDFVIGPASGSSNSATIAAGQTASFNLAVTPAGSFSGTVSLSCAITPAVTPAPLCTVPSSVNVTEGTAAAATAKISTTAPGTAGSISQAKLPPGMMPLRWTIILLASGLLFFGCRRKMPVLAIPMMAVLLLGLSACGGGGGGGSSPMKMPGTPAGTYTATVTGTFTSGPTKLTHSDNLTLVVQ